MPDTMTPPAAPLLVDRPTAAGLLGISVRTLDQLIADGQLRPTRIGARVLVSRQALEQFILDRADSPE